MVDTKTFALTLVVVGSELATTDLIEIVVAGDSKKVPPSLFLGWPSQMGADALQ